MRQMAEKNWMETCCITEFCLVYFWTHVFPGIKAITWLSSFVFCAQWVFKIDLSDMLHFQGRNVFFLPPTISLPSESILRLVSPMFYSAYELIISWAQGTGSIRKDRDEDWWVREREKKPKPEWEEPGGSAIAQPLLVNNRQLWCWTFTTREARVILPPGHALACWSWNPSHGLHLEALKKDSASSKWVVINS